MEQDKLTGWKLVLIWVSAIAFGWCVLFGIAEGIVNLIERFYG